MTLAKIISTAFVFFHEFFCDEGVVPTPDAIKCWFTPSLAGVKILESVLKITLIVCYCHTEYNGTFPEKKYYKQAN